MSTIIKRALLLASLFLFLANIANAQNSRTAYCSLNGVGNVCDLKTSSYITPGSSVSWSLYYRTFNVSLDGSAYTNACAFIGDQNGVYFNNNAYIYVYNSGYYQELDNSASGGGVYSSGGYLTAGAELTVNTQGGGGTVGAYLSW
jgi:hypothetical protein